MKKFIIGCLLVTTVVSSLGLGNFRTVNNIQELVATNNNPFNILTNYLVVDQGGAMFYWNPTLSTATNEESVFESLYVKNILGVSTGRFQQFGPVFPGSNSVVVAYPIGTPPYYAYWVGTNLQVAGNIQFTDPTTSTFVGLVGQVIQVTGVGTNEFDNAQVTNYLWSIGPFYMGTNIHNFIIDANGKTHTTKNVVVTNLAVGDTAVLDFNIPTATNSLSGAFTLTHGTNNSAGEDSVVKRILYNYSGSDQNITIPSAWKTNAFSPVPAKATNGTITIIHANAIADISSSSLQSNILVSFEYFK